MTALSNWIAHIHPQDKDSVYKDYSHALESNDKEWKCNYRFLKSDGSVEKVVSNAVIMRNIEGVAVRVIGYMQNLNKERVLEERLENEIKLKEKQIEDAIKDAKEAERSDLGKELHDNVNQLLGASKLYLEIAKRGGSRSKFYLNRSTEYTMSAIEEIRKLTKGLTTDLIKKLGLAEAIENIISDTMEVNPVKISYTLDGTIEESVNDKFKLNVFRIVQEQLNNILKHAKANKVTIRLSQNIKSIILSISDNGVGFNADKQSNGIGLANIKSRAASYKGNADFITQPDNGCVLIVTFPLTNAIYKVRSHATTSNSK